MHVSVLLALQTKNLFCPEVRSASSLKDWSGAWFNCRILWKGENHIQTPPPPSLSILFTTKYIKINSKFSRVFWLLIFQNFWLMQIKCSNKQTNKQTLILPLIFFPQGWRNGRRKLCWNGIQSEKWARKIEAKSIWLFEFLFWWKVRN